VHISEDYNTTFLRHIDNYLTFDTVRPNIPEDIATVRTSHFTAMYPHSFFFAFLIQQLHNS